MGTEKREFRKSMFQILKITHFSNESNPPSLDSTLAVVSKGSLENLIFPSQNLPIRQNGNFDSDNCQFRQEL